MSGGAGEGARYRKWIELELLGELPHDQRTRLHDHLRVNPEARAEYDRGIAAYRVLEQEAEVSRFELDQVEAWLFEGAGERGFVDAPARASSSRGWLRWLLASGLGAAATALVVLWVIQPPGRESSPAVPDATTSAQEPAPKGSAHAGGLALGVLCATPDARASTEASGLAMRPAELEPCPLDGVLGFEYRARARGDDRVLSLFGVDEDGRVLYYAPTPADLGAVSVEYGRSVAAPLTVRAAVNHKPGRVRIFGLLSATTPTLNQIDRWASSLKSSAAVGIDRPPWHRRLEPEQVAAVCPELEACDSAEASFVLREVDR